MSPTLHTYVERRVSKFIYTAPSKPMPSLPFLYPQTSDPIEVNLHAFATMDFASAIRRNRITRSQLLCTFITIHVLAPAGLLNIVLDPSMFGPDLASSKNKLHNYDSTMRKWNVPAGKGLTAFTFTSQPMNAFIHVAT